MSEYGVTEKGFVRKRLDVILKEIQDEQTEKFGFDVAQNPQSILNVLNTQQADKIAKLWELAEQVYYSHYPSTAEGVNLDFACQFGGVLREEDSRTKYIILCTGDDGTALPRGTRIASSTTPKVYFTIYRDYEISRSAFNKVKIRVVTAADQTAYTVTINGNAYTALSGTGASKSSIISALSAAINEEGFVVTASGETLVLSDEAETKSNALTLSENLTTSEVSSLITFESEEYGKVVMPYSSITEIITTVVGFNSCYNLDFATYGRTRQSDVEYRHSYLKKIGSRSSMMLKSIEGAILENADGVKAVVAYENETDSTDAAGRPPHSIEIVVDGGVDALIAQQILLKKAAGIQTFGAVSVAVPGLYGETITVRFNRPTMVYAWLMVSVTANPNQSLPQNYIELIKRSIVLQAAGAGVGDDILTQDFIAGCKASCSGIGYLDINAYSSYDIDDAPGSPEAYTLKNIYVSEREKVAIDVGRIEVVMSGS